MTPEELLAALSRATRTGQGGGRMSYLVLQALAARSERDVLALYRAAFGNLTQEQLVLMLAATLTRHVRTAWETGSVYGRGDVSRAGSGITAVPVVPDDYTSPPEDFSQVGALFALPLVLDDPLPRLEQAFATILGGPEEEVVERLEKIANDEPVNAAVRAYQQEGRAAGVRGYRRRTNPDCCQLCFWLWKGGYVYPIDQPMHRHTGCRCYPEFTTDAIGLRQSEQDRALEIEFLLKYPSKNTPEGRTERLRDELEKIRG